MAFDDDFTSALTRRTATAVITLALMTATPAMAQIIIGDDGTSSVETAPVANQIPSWLLKYATPEPKKSTKADKPVKPKKAAKPAKIEPTLHSLPIAPLANDETLDHAAPATTSHTTQATADQDDYIMTPPKPPLDYLPKQKPVPPRPQVAENHTDEAPWSPRAQVPTRTNLFPELGPQETVAERAGLMVAPQLAGDKPNTTRRDTTLPPVVTPNLMDSMVLAARESNGTLNDDETDASRPVASVTVHEEDFKTEDGAYSPSKSGTEGKYVLGTMGERPSASSSEASDTQSAGEQPVKKKSRKLFSVGKNGPDEEQTEAPKAHAKLLADINQEPKPSAPDQDQEPFLPPSPTPTPVPGSQTLGTLPVRRDDELAVPEKPDMDTMQPLDTPTTAAKPRLLAALSDTKQDVYAHQTITPPPSLTPAAGSASSGSTVRNLNDQLPARYIASTPTPPVPAPKAAAVPVPEIKVDTPAPVAAAPEVKVSVEPTVPVVAPTAPASTDDIDITQMASAPRLLGRTGDSDSAPAPKAAPTMAVEKSDTPEIKVAVDTPAPSQHTLPAKPSASQMDLFNNDAPESPSAAAPEKTLLTLNNEPPAAAPEIKVETPTEPAVVAKPKKSKKAKTETLAVAEPTPEIRVETPAAVPTMPVEKSAAPEIKVEVPKAPTASNEVRVEIPDAPVDVAAAEPEQPQSMNILRAPNAHDTAAQNMPRVTVAAAPPAQKIESPVSRTPIPLATIDTPLRAPEAMQPAESQKIVPMPEEPKPEMVLTPSRHVSAPSMPIQTITPPPNLRVETPAAPAGGAPRLRTPRLVTDTPATPTAPTAPTAPTQDEPATIMPGSAATPAPSMAPDIEDKGSSKQTVYFAPTVKDLDEASKQQVDNLAEQLEDNPNQRVTLTAYADAELVVEARRLALARALAIRSRLAKQGIQPIRIDVKAVGPKTANDNSVADRVDVVIK